VVAFSFDRKRRRIHRWRVGRPCRTHHDAFAVLFFDVRWIQAEMNAPGWDGVPDMDIIFQFGVLLRVVLINVVLLPVALFARWMSLRRVRAAIQPVA
jgi:hypothetical protein